MATKSRLTPMAEAKEEVKQLIEDRKISETVKNSNSWTVSLLWGRSHYIQPKHIYTASNGQKVALRYVADENSIFEDEQNGGDVEISHINIKKETTVNDRTKLDFILTSPAYGTRFELYDPMAEAEDEIAKTELFDKVWREVGDSTPEVRKAIYIKYTGEPASKVFKETTPELKLKLRNLTQKDPKGMEEVLEDPTLQTLYLYSMAEMLKYVTYNGKTRQVKWESGDEICKVPVDKKVSSYMASILTEDNYQDVRKALDDKLKK